MSQSNVGLLHMTHDLWLTEWSRLHGTITSSRTTMLPAAKLLLSKNGRHSTTFIHCAKSPDLKPIDNFWADIKPDLSRNTQRNVLEFEITIHDILNQIPSKMSSQCLVTWADPGIFNRGGTKYSRI